MAKMINTVRGPVAIDDLGVTLIHEHFVFGYPGFDGYNSLSDFDKEECKKRCKEMVQPLKEKYGLKTIVDATPNECGRDVRLLREISEYCDIHIIVISGYYYDGPGGGATAYLRMRQAFFQNSEQEIYDLMKKEMYEGIDGTDIKAGFLKCSTAVGGPTDYDEWSFRAASRLANEDPDVRIMTHTSEGTGAMAQAQLFLDNKVNPAQVMIGHFCDDTNIANLMPVLELGFYCGYDRMGLVGAVGCPDDKYKMACIFGLTGAGYGDKIILAHDYIRVLLGKAWNFSPELMESMFKNWHWGFIFETVLPTLQKMGLTKEQTQAFVDGNVKKFLKGE